jgi:hypothetical protein
MIYSGFTIEIERNQKERKKKEIKEKKRRKL